MRRLAISAGHYLERPGAKVSFKQNGKRITLIEHELACQVIEELYLILVADGYSVFETPRTPLSEKVRFINSLPALDLALEVHFNAGPPGAEGTETIYFSEEGEKLAWAMMSGLMARLPFANRGAKKDETILRNGEPFISYFLRRTYPPAVLVEVCFLTNPGDRSFLLSRSAFYEIASALKQGIDEYYLTLEKDEVKEWTRLSSLS